MKKRFEGDGHDQLLEALGRQEFASGKPEIIADLIAKGELVEFKSGEKLIEENESDNDVYLIVAGTVSVVVKGNEVRTLAVGDHVGEMAAIETSHPRSATVVAQGTVVAQKILGAAFIRICDKFPTMWKPISRELSHRLYDRNRLIKEPNELSRLFIISSVEALDVAREIASGLQHDVLATVWTEGVFWASGYALEALENAVAQSDFAVAVAQFEDVVQSRGKTHQALRDNVVFELGMFMGQLGRRRTFLVHPKLHDLQLPSDLHGITPASYIVGKPEDLAARMGPVCTEIRKIVRTIGVRTHKG
jgi:CRP/FNR family cyclic AMP-dependent transcriptional regulator